MSAKCFTQRVQSAGKPRFVIAFRWHDKAKMKYFSANYETEQLAETVCMRLNDQLVDAGNIKQIIDVNFSYPLEQVLEMPSVESKLRLQEAE